MLPSEHGVNAAYYYVDDVCVRAATSTDNYNCVLIANAEPILGDSTAIDVDTLRLSRDTIANWVLHFSNDDFLLADSVVKILSVAIDLLKSDTALKATISGHANSMGSDLYNKDLSLRRAESVKRYLVERGILESRLMVSGFGATNPIANNDTKKGREINRRVEIQIERE